MKDERARIDRREVPRAGLARRVAAGMLLGGMVFAFPDWTVGSDLPPGADAAPQERGGDGRLDPPEVLVARGRSLIQVGDWPRAIEAFRSALARDPRNVDALYGLGLTYGVRKAYENAIAVYREMQRLAPDDERSYVNLAQLYAQLSEFPEEIAQYERLLRLRPDRADARFLLGNAYLKVGRYADGIAAFRRTLALRPSFVPALYALSMAHLWAGDRARARDVARELGQQDPDRARYLLNMIGPN